MPALEPPRRHQPAGDPSPSSARQRTPDLSAVPAFLREPGTRRGRTGDAPADADATSAGRPDQRPVIAIPRPATPPSAAAAAAAPRLDPASLPMPSLSRRRVVTAAGVLLAGLLAISFVRQVGEATAATTRADDLRAANAALRDEVARLQHDLGTVQDDRFIKLEGRAYGLGGRGEIPFALAGGAPALPDDAPGSASTRLGTEPDTRGPLETWLEVLFGSSD